MLPGFPPFNRKYGVLTDDGTYQIPARWQAGLSNGAAAFGIQVNEIPTVSEIVAHRMSMPAFEKARAIHQADYPKQQETAGEQS